MSKEFPFTFKTDLSNVDILLLEVYIESSISKTGYGSEIKKQSVIKKLQDLRQLLVVNLVNETMAERIFVERCINEITENDCALSLENVDILNQIHSLYDCS